MFRSYLFCLLSAFLLPVFAVTAQAEVALPAKRAPVACTMEAKLCPDGSSVSRQGPDCSFAPCPGDAGAASPPVNNAPPPVNNAPPPASPPPVSGSNVMPGGDIGDGMDEPAPQGSGDGSPPEMSPPAPKQKQ